METSRAGHLVRVSPSCSGLVNPRSAAGVAKATGVRKVPAHGFDSTGTGRKRFVDQRVPPPPSRDEPSSIFADSLGLGPGVRAVGETVSHRAHRPWAAGNPGI